MLGGVHVHAMPFGAEVRADGATRFRLWAPAARTVELWLEERSRAIPMPRDREGWAEVVVDGVRGGARYRYRIDRELLVPDPASRFQPEDVHGPSEVIDPGAHGWGDGDWTGVAPEDLVIYELHVGTFTPAGTFRAVIDRLGHLAGLGVTAIELMPVADFPGRWGWGYDGVLLFAPDGRYGRPEDLKALVEACHASGIAVFLDVVYNHFGPEGNYLHRYAPAFFSRRHRTPWGDALNFDGAGAAVVRSFVVHNALYWIEEFHIDGLRLDAGHAIRDDSSPDVLVELAEAVRDGPGRERTVHLVLEHDDNAARYLAREGRQPRWYLAQWNDDLHHALHVLVTGERGGYCADYDPPLAALGRCLVSGFAYQGEWSSYRGRPRGEPTEDLPPTAFVGFLQNHDQVGNRALGERLTAIAPPEAARAVTAVLLLAPTLPLLFMGQEWAAAEPFLFFSDLGPDLGPSVGEGRRREFARFPEFADPARREQIPDPQAPATHARSVLDWAAVRRPPHDAWLELHRDLLGRRRREVAPLLRGGQVPAARWRPLGATALEATWAFPGGSALTLVANLGPRSAPRPEPDPDRGRLVWGPAGAGPDGTALPPWTVAWYRRDG
jgi:malto-oligosyltrehalose trehalohydrolase